MHVYRPQSWSGVAVRLRAEPQKTMLRLPKYLMEHPEAAGARRSVGMPQGQEADYRLSLPTRESLHIRDFGMHYEVHLDQVDPAYDAIEHLRQDAPNAYIAGAAALGALLSLALGANKNAMLVGAGLGALVGVLLLTNEPSTSAQT